MRIWENLKRIRKQRGLTLAALAKIASLNLNTINRVEKGRNPSPTTLRKLSEALNIKTEKFYK